jgi:hypothetical protein
LISPRIIDSAIRSSVSALNPAGMSIGNRSHAEEDED